MFTRSNTINQQRTRGFTLIEMLVVLVIITMLATLVGPTLFNKIGSSKTKVAYAQIELIGSALDAYRLDVGTYPTTEQGLAALRKRPEGVKNWDGPYLSKDVPNDPWDNPYHYKRPGKDHPYALYSLGLDGTEGGEGEDQDQGFF
jgi:general secretion pathway protein G